MASELTDADWGGVSFDQETPLTIIFVRHGQAEPRSDDGPMGPRLTRLGKRQAARVAKRLATDKFDYIYISDVARANETAQQIMKFHENTPCSVTTAAREITSFHFTARAEPSDPIVRDGVAMEHDTIMRFTNQLRHKHVPGQRVLVVAHGNFIRTVLPILGGRDPKESVIMEISNTAVSIIEVWESGEAVLHLGNCVRHLLPGQVT